MIKFIEHTDVNKKKWDECVEKSFNKRFFSYSYVLDILSPQWNALVYNDYEAIFPLTARKKFGIAYLYQPFFINYFDVYCVNKKTYNNVANQFLSAIPDFYKYIDICVSPEMKTTVLGISFIEQKCQALILSDSAENIQKKYSDNTKRNIKKARAEELSFDKNTSIDKHVNDFKKENAKKIKAFSAADYTNMKKLLFELSKRNNLLCMSAQGSKDGICASASFIFCNNRIVYFKSSANDYGKKVGAMHLLMNHVIAEYGNKYAVLDFYGSNVETVARFNKGFGANDYIYYRVKKNNLPALLRLIKK